MTRISEADQRAAQAALKVIAGADNPSAFGGAIGQLRSIAAGSEDRFPGGDGREPRNTLDAYRGRVRNVGPEAEDAGSMSKAEQDAQTMLADGESRLRGRAKAGKITGGQLERGLAAIRRARRALGVREPDEDEGMSKSETALLALHDRVRPRLRKAEARGETLRLEDDVRKAERELGTEYLMRHSAGYQRVQAAKAEGARV